VGPLRDSITKGLTGRITGSKHPERKAYSEGPWLADGLWLVTGVQISQTARVGNRRGGLVGPEADKGLRSFVIRWTCIVSGFEGVDEGFYPAYTARFPLYIAVEGPARLQAYRYRK